MKIFRETRFSRRNVVEKITQNNKSQARIPLDKYDGPPKFLVIAFEVSHGQAYGTLREWVCEKRKSRFAVHRADYVCEDSDALAASNLAGDEVVEVRFDYQGLSRPWRGFDAACATDLNDAPRDIGLRMRIVAAVWFKREGTTERSISDGQKFPFEPFFSLCEAKRAYEDVPVVWIKASPLFRHGKRRRAASDREVSRTAANGI
jgi:hypothetical protein